MDGKIETRQVLIDKDIVWPNALTIDYQKANLWWADAKLAKIERCNLDGTNRRIVMQRNVGAPFSIAVSARHVYWTNWENKRIERIEKDTWNKNHIQSRSFSKHPLAVTLIDGRKHEAGMYPEFIAYRIYILLFSLAILDVCHSFLYLLRLQNIRY